MQPLGFTVRRATVDDLPLLKPLWARAGLPVLEEEKHLTEFQLMFADDGQLAGAVGLQIAGKSGRIHSEAFVNPEKEELQRPHLWARLRIVAKNHGLSRLWTTEPSPFWHREAGFAPATSDELKKLPAPFGNSHTAWQTLAIREESLEVISLEKEFELFQQQQMQSTSEAMRQARRLKWLAYVLLALSLAGAGYVAFNLLTRGPGVLDLMRR